MTLDLFRFFRLSILPIMYVRRVSHVLCLAWLALFLSVWTTADLVIDLVFEEQEVVAEANGATEDPDDVAEHLLMPSERVSNLAQNTVTAPQTPDLEIFSFAIPVSGITASNADPPPLPLPRNNPVSFSVPLRI